VIGILLLKYCYKVIDPTLTVKQRELAVSFLAMDVSNVQDMERTVPECAVVAHR